MHTDTPPRQRQTLHTAAFAFARRERRLTLTQIAQRSGFSLGYVNDLEKGRRQGNAAVIEALAKALGVEPELLTTQSAS